MQQAAAHRGRDGLHGAGVRALPALRDPAVLPGDGAAGPAPGAPGPALRRVREPGEHPGLPLPVLPQGAGGLLETPAEGGPVLPTLRRNTHTR